TIRWKVKSAAGGATWTSEAPRIFNVRKPPGPASQLADAPSPKLSLMTIELTPTSVPAAVSAAMWTENVMAAALNVAVVSAVTDCPPEPESRSDDTGSE